MSRYKLAPLVVFALVMASVPTLAACSQEEALIYTSADDVAVDAAVKEARRTLPVFWTKFDAQAPGYGAFALKVGLDADGTRMEIEHIWVDNLARANGKVFGHLANEPVALAGLSEGSRVEVEASRITDWQYAKDGKLYGHFTTRALSPKANAEQRALTAELFAPTPLEAGTN